MAKVPGFGAGGPWFESRYDNNVIMSIILIVITGITVILVRNPRESEPFKFGKV